MTTPIHDDRSVGHDPAVEPMAPDMSLGELFRDMTSDVGRLINKELELARVEAREEVSKAARGAGMFAGAAVAALLALFLLSLALAAWLDEVMHPAVALAIVGAAWVVIAAVLASVARARLAEVSPLPQTKETLQEDVQWAKQQMS